jgi:hypothetical protein
MLCQPDALAIQFTSCSPKNANNYQPDLSPAEASCNWNIKKTTMQETIREFIELGYLAQIYAIITVLDNTVVIAFNGRIIKCLIDLT